MASFKSTTNINVNELIENKKDVVLPRLRVTILPSDVRDCDKKGLR